MKTNEKVEHQSAVPQYITQAKKEAMSAKNKNTRAFFKALHETLSAQWKASDRPSDKSYLPRAFDHALKELLHPLEIPEKERELKRFECFQPSLRQLSSEASFLSKKRPDYILENNKNKRIVILELKTNISFNDFSAAIVQAFLIKKMAESKGDYHYYIASIHMASWKDDPEKYYWMNKQFGNPLDDVWIFSAQPKGAPSELKFDVAAIEAFGAKVTNFLNGQS